MSIVLVGSTSGSITLQEPAVAGSTVLSLPATSGTFITTGSSGQSIPKAALPAGSVLQVVHTAKTNTFSGTSVLDNGGYFIDVTGMSASITPTSASNKILIITSLYGSNINGYNFSYRLKRTIGGVTTFPIVGTSEGGRPVTTGRSTGYDPTYAVYNTLNPGGTHQDSPNTTSAITYQVQIGGYDADATVYLNRSYLFQASANNYDTIPVSTITLMEIAG